MIFLKKSIRGQFDDIVQQSTIQKKKEVTFQSLWKGEVWLHLDFLGWLAG